MLKAFPEGSIVLTIALGLALTIVQPQSIRRKLNSYNFGAGLDYGKTAALKHQKRAQLSRQKLSDSPRQIYNAQAAYLWTTCKGLQSSPSASATKSLTIKGLHCLAKRSSSEELARIHKLLISLQARRYA
jgi:hypothetical protein